MPNSKRQVEDSDIKSYEPQVGGYGSPSDTDLGGKAPSTTGSIHSTNSTKKRRTQRMNRALICQQTHAAQKSEIFEALGFDSDSTGTTSSELSVLYRQRDSDHETLVLDTFRAASDPIFASYKRLSAPGTVYVVDKDTLDVHLVACITPFSSMAPQDRDEFQTIFSHLREDSKFKYNITRNGAMLNGNMFGLGWRAGYDAGVSMGTYAAKSTVLGKQEKAAQWKVLKTKEKIVHDIYGRRFCSLAPTLFDNTTEFLSTNSLPYLGYRYDEEMPEDSESYLFASNLTYTIKNFHNKAHHDYDASDVTYGIWAPCDQYGTLAEKNVGFEKRNGFFYVAPYKILVDFAAVDGVVELIWRGATDAHATVDGEVTEGFETWGSSCQTSQHLVNRITKALKEVSDHMDIKVKHN